MKEQTLSSSHAKAQSSTTTHAKSESTFFEKSPSTPFFKANPSSATKATLQMKEGGSAPKSDASAPQSKNDTGLPDSLKSGVENLSGYSMDDVRVHRNSDKPAKLQAHAYAQGTDIHLGPGQEKHLPHEAWHVVQQKQGRVRPTLQMKSGVNVNDDTALEREADVMGEKAVRSGSQIFGNPSPAIQLKEKPFSASSNVVQLAKFRWDSKNERWEHLSGDSPKDAKKPKVPGDFEGQEYDDVKDSYTSLPAAAAAEQATPPKEGAEKDKEAAPPTEAPIDVAAHCLVDAHLTIDQVDERLRPHLLPFKSVIGFTYTTAANGYLVRVDLQFGNWKVGVWWPTIWLAIGGAKVIPAPNRLGIAPSAEFGTPNFAGETPPKDTIGDVAAFSYKIGGGSMYTPPCTAKCGCTKKLDDFRSVFRLVKSLSTDEAKIAAIKEKYG